MSVGRTEMAAALKRLVLPELRERGFRGSFPHFRREVGERIDLLAFQFSAWGGKFAVELAKAPSGGVRVGGRHIPADKLRVRHVISRKRIGPQDADGDRWFSFVSGEPDEVAASVLRYLSRQGKGWWARAG